MMIVQALPPNYGRVVARFPKASRPGTVFAWGDRLYVPNGSAVSPELAAHEGIHGVRQIEMGVEAWWDRYLSDDSFVLTEEIPAHHAEYSNYCEHHSRGRSRFLKEVAKRLSGPLYNHPVTFDRALHLVKWGERK